MLFGAAQGIWEPGCNPGSFGAGFKAVDELAHCHLFSPGV